MGGFTTSTDFTAPAVSNTEQLSVADFNGDGKPDIASKDVILQGNGLGGFTLQNTFPRGDSSYFEVADLDGDGRVDIVAYTFDDILTNTLGYTSFLSVCNLVKDTGRLDYDGDGETDIAVFRRRRAVAEITQRQLSFQALSAFPLRELRVSAVKCLFRNLP